MRILSKPRNPIFAGIFFVNASQVKSYILRNQNVAFSCFQAERIPPCYTFSMEGFSMIPKTILFSHKKEKLRVAAYCRVSTNHPDQFGSLETQKAYFETIIRENPNWQFVKIYSDIGSALRTNSRPGYRQMIPDGEKGLFDLVLVKSLSRFGRDTIDIVKIS